MSNRIKNENAVRKWKYWCLLPRQRCGYRQWFLYRSWLRKTTILDPQHDVVLRVDDSLRASCYCSVLISALWSGVWLFPACDYNCITRADLPGILTEEASIEWECHRRSIYRMSLTAMIVIVFLKSTLHNHQHAYVKATLIEQMTNTCISNLIN